MKRLIKYWNQYNDSYFSDCSTEYEILDLVDDSFGYKELRQLAELNDIEVVGKCFKPEFYNSWKLGITHAIKIKDPVTTDTGVYFKGEPKQVDAYLGFITLPDVEYIPALETLNNELTQEQVDNLISYQDLSISNLAEINESGLRIIIEDWDYFHSLKLLGYSFKSLHKLCGTDECTFSDEVEFCHECGAYDWRDDGYTYNHRIVDDCHLLGINCGCYDEYCKSDAGLNEFSDNPDKCMESDSADELVESNKIEFLERFVGGMTDSWRTHHYDGQPVRVLSPDEALIEYKDKLPESCFLFVRDESGQFQTYYSLYKIV